MSGIRGKRGRYKPRFPPETKRFIWTAVQLRDMLTDKMIARHTGLTMGQVKGQIQYMRMRGAP
jgi:hypothetical protein